MHKTIDNTEMFEQIEKEQIFSELSEVFCRAFHRQKWDHDCEEPSEINRTAWKNCVKAVIEAYEKDKKDLREE